MKTLPADLQSQIRTTDIDFFSTERLAVVYHRNLARRAVGSAAQHPDVAAAVRRVRRLPSSLVHRAYRPSRYAPQQAGTATLVRALEAAARPAGDTGVFRGPVGIWLADGLDEAVGSLSGDHTGAARVVSSPPRQAYRSLDLARQALRSCWPDAWREHNVLVEQMVFTEGPLRSASARSTFGTVFTSLEEGRNDPLRLFEVLLHETGHHSLTLREQFTSYLHNPAQLAGHPLRRDPRPLRGVLHAAFVLHRMEEGFRRYLEVHRRGGPLDGRPVEERFGFVREALAATVAVLDDAAQWTQDGLALRAALTVSRPEMESA